jgi:hypothetical protein
MIFYCFRSATSGSAHHALAVTQLRALVLASRVLLSHHLLWSGPPLWSMLLHPFRVKAASEAEVAWQQKLTAAEAEIAELRQNIEVSYG